MKRTAFYVSDRTGITAEMFGRSLLTQFSDLEVEETTIPFVDTPAKARAAAERINRAAANGSALPLVFGTLVSKETSDVLRSSSCLFINYFEIFLERLEKELGLKASWQTGTSHSMSGFENYQRRIDAINFTMGHDDGTSVKSLEEADIVLVGISRCGKTPTCLYMAIHFGVFAANYPLIPEDLDHNEMPQSLLAHSRKLYGLTIQATRLSQIREKRRANSEYASLANCQREIDTAERLMCTSRIPVIDVTHRSVEEISATILQDTKLKRHIY
jgi:regulator of PEP synthase PpsR (kinase-PPPase family)